MESDSNQLADIIARKFIARKDVKAVQKMLPTGDCIYVPHCQGNPDEKNYIGWDRASLVSHIEGTRSYGHYLLNQDNQCKFFAFDVDLEKKGWYFNKDGDIPIEDEQPIEFNPRDAWHDRSHPGRWWMKAQLRTVAGLLASKIHEELGVPVAAYYSGNKGVHVYAFTGLIDAWQAREGARIVLDAMDIWEPLRGENFFCHKNKDPFEGYPNLSIEVFPKQDTMTDKSGLGNLMRAPLGRNKKNPKDPTFFLDLRSPLSDLKPVDPIWALTTASQWGDS